MAEPFKGPFTTHEDTSDIALERWYILDSQQRMVADRRDRDQAQWLCDRLNSAAPAPAVLGERAKEAAEKIVAIAENPGLTFGDKRAQIAALLLPYVSPVPGLTEEERKVIAEIQGRVFSRKGRPSRRDLSEAFAIIDRLTSPSDQSR